MFDDNQFIAFRQHFELTHPSAVPVLHLPNEADFPAHYKYHQWLRKVVIVTLICSALLAGVHTIGVVYNGIPTGAIVTEFIRRVASILSFGALELSVFVSAYVLDKNKWLARSMLAVGFLVSMAANIYSVFSAFSTTDNGVRVVAVLLGIGAPLMALLMGVLSVEIDNDQRTAKADAISRYNQAKKEADKRYQKALEVFDGSVLSEYNAWLQRSARKSRVQNPSISVSKDVQNGQIGQVAGQSESVHALPQNVSSTGKMDAWTRVEQYFVDNPASASLSVRELERLIGVSKSSISAYLKTKRDGLSSGVRNGQEMSHRNWFWRVKLYWKAGMTPVNVWVYAAFTFSEAIRFGRTLGKTQSYNITEMVNGQPKADNGFNREDEQTTEPSDTTSGQSLGVLFIKSGDD